MDRSASRTRAPIMSLDAALDEENREVLASLDRKRTRSPMARTDRTATPPPRVRSMLDVDSPTPRHGSIAGIGVGITSPYQTNRSTRLDPSDPSTWTSPHTTSKPNSPTLTRATPSTTRQRGASDLGTQSYVGLPRIQGENKRDFAQDYQFDLSSIPTSAKPPTSETKRPREGSGGAMAAALTGDFTSLDIGGAHVGRHNSTAGVGSYSRSPSSRIRNPESSKPGALPSPSSPPAGKKYVTESGTVVDNKAHRMLSSGTLESFSSVGDDVGEGAGRVGGDGVGEDDAVEDSSDEAHHSDDSEEDQARGRKGRQAASETGESKETPAAMGQAPEPKEAQSQMATAEQERKTVSHSQAIRSLLEPSISITGPSGEKLPQGTGVRPSNSARSASPARSDLDDDEGEAIRRAKALPLMMSGVDSRVPDRHVRMLLRGDWNKFHQEAESGRRNNRTYLCCTDLSLEATYALEWTVGTIMRDGDTLLGIYAIEDENAGKTTEAERDVLQAEGAKAGQQANEAMADLTRQTTMGGGSSINALNKYIPATEAQSLTGSVDARTTSKKQMERLHAIDEITQNFMKLVRRTTLQVRCMVEVIHCKSPKHLILGAIDELNPTLTIVGTRGRSSLKGVLLGSFSNYLVTKSSVPVMVARKKLRNKRSHHAKVSSTKIRLSNNLSANSLSVKRRGLEGARID